MADEARRQSETSQSDDYLTNRTDPASSPDAPNDAEVRGAAEPARRGRRPPRGADERGFMKSDLSSGSE